MRNGTLIAGLATALVVAACHGNFPGTGPERVYEPPRSLGPAFAAPGSEWSYVRKDSGSYGDGMSQVTWKSLPMQNYQGRPHYAYEGPEATLLIEPRSGSYAAQMKGGKLDVSWDPPLNFYHWPVWVGESWSTPYKVTNHASNQTKDMRAWYKVEDQQTVHVPAGSFKTFRILYSTDTVWGHIWWSPELGITVKSRLERVSSDPAGAGVRESDLLRQSLK
jgi:hypothetical protein